ncbi:TetR/AcrR family transcriptional regulator [Amycolatopsis sp. TRM77291]
MRENKRSQILDAATRVVQDQGIAAVTFDAVAAASGVSRGGVMYHFPSREALLASLHEHQAEAWESAMIAVAGKPAGEASDEEKAVAYARACSQSATKAELQLLLEAVADPEHKVPWISVIDRWTPAIDTSEDTDINEDQLRRFIARLATDGLWMYESLSANTLPDKVRESIVEYIEHCILAPTQSDQTTGDHASPLPMKSPEPKYIV